MTKNNPFLVAMAGGNRGGNVTRRNQQKREDDRESREDYQWQNHRTVKIYGNRNHKKNRKRMDDAETQQEQNHKQAVYEWNRTFEANEPKSVRLMTDDELQSEKQMLIVVHYYLDDAVTGKVENRFDDICEEIARRRNSGGANH